MNWERTASALSPAAPRAVWDVLLDGRRWSYWNPGVEWMWLEGEAGAGTLATIKLARVRQTALVVKEANPPRCFALGLTVGPVARLELTWTLFEAAAGTRIEAKVAISGVAAGFLLQRSAIRIATALPSHLDRLAARAAIECFVD